MHEFSIQINEHLSLVFPRLEHAETLFQLVDSDREHLRPFLDFVDTTTTIEDERNYLAMKLTGYANGTDCLYLISYKETIVGSIDLHFINKRFKKAEIGYWIHSSCTGKSITTLCVNKLCEIAFTQLGLNKLTIVADTENIASNRVAKKSGFAFIGTLPQDILLYEQFRDMNSYSLLKEHYHR